MEQIEHCFAFSIPDDAFFEVIPCVSGNEFLIPSDRLIERLVLPCRVFIKNDSFSHCCVADCIGESVIRGRACLRFRVIFLC